MHIDISTDFDHFNLILHSIDGPSLRNSAAQKMLCEFAQIPGVHLVVSMDHPNLPLCTFPEIWQPQGHYVVFERTGIERYPRIELDSMVHIIALGVIVESCCCLGKPYRVSLCIVGAGIA